MQNQHETIINLLSDSVQQTNRLVRHAVESGLSVEIIRASRCHDGGGHWGDQIKPYIQDSL